MLCNTSKFDDQNVGQAFHLQGGGSKSGQARLWLCCCCGLSPWIVVFVFNWIFDIIPHSSSGSKPIISTGEQCTLDQDIQEVGLLYQVGGKKSDNILCWITNTMWPKVRHEDFRDGRGRQIFSDTSNHDRVSLLTKEKIQKQIWIALKWCYDLRCRLQTF